jgi:hypothetical protein
MFAVPPRDTSFITPNDAFYLVHHNGVPELNAARWKLSITGRVRRPMTLIYADFLSMRSVEAMVTLACIDTLPGGSTIGNGVWNGVPLKELLERAGIEPDAADVVFHAADGYSDSIPVSRVMQGGILLAHSMNGAALPRDHGFPLRVIAPGLYGIKNVKWLTGIEVVEHDYKGYWQQRGWTDTGRIKVVSRIDQPGHYQSVKRPEVSVRGIAFAGAEGVGGVEVSTDNARTFHPAAIVEAKSPAAWVIWEYRWAVQKAGAYTLAVRAEDRFGREQSPQILQAYPAGSSGLHTIVVLVE